MNQFNDDSSPSPEILFNSRFKPIAIRFKSALGSTLSRTDLLVALQSRLSPVLCHVSLSSLLADCTLFSTDLAASTPPSTLCRQSDSASVAATSDGCLVCASHRTSHLVRPRKTYISALLRATATRGDSSFIAVSGLKYSLSPAPSLSSPPLTLCLWVPVYLTRNDAPIF